MKSKDRINGRILTTDSDSRMIFIRIAVGLIFLTEGIQKFTVVSIIGPAYFEEIGFGRPMFWAYFTGSFEIASGILILTGFLTRIAAVPLLIIMVTALFKTKLPLILSKGFLTFAHEYAIDFSMTILLVILLIYGGGKWSADSAISRSRK